MLEDCVRRAMLEDCLGRAVLQNCPGRAMLEDCVRRAVSEDCLRRAALEIRRLSQQGFVKLLPWKRFVSKVWANKISTIAPCN